MEISAMLVPGLTVTEVQVLVARSAKSKKILSVYEVLGNLLNHFNMSWEELSIKRRHRPVVVPRQLFCYFCKQYTVASLQTIGNTIGVDHATVLHCLRVVNDLLEVHDNPEVLRDLHIIDFKLKKLVKG